MLYFSPERGEVAVVVSTEASVAVVAGLDEEHQRLNSFLEALDQYLREWP